MAEPFKNLFNPDLIDKISYILARLDSSFKREAFVAAAAKGLDDLEMMARADQISTALEAGFTQDYLENLATLVQALHPSKTSALSDMQTDESGIAGWAIVPLASYVARLGMGHPDASLDALREMTMRFSAEFAVRYFFRDCSELTLQKVKIWAVDPNPHVRRLASEGARPLLPWGIKLHQFVADPAPVLEILEVLRDDPSDYVRKSVANNLNDISKDHPDLVASLASSWLRDAPPHRKKLVKHASRTLIKAGHPGALANFGFTRPQLSNIKLSIPEKVKLGSDMMIDLSFSAQTNQSLLIDYAVHFMRANGTLSPKVFKWTECRVDAGEAKGIAKKHPYKKVTTRKDYAGEQVLSVQVNGVEIARQGFSFSL